MAEITLIVCVFILSVIMPVVFYRLGYIRGQLNKMETPPDGRLHCIGGSYKPHEMQPTESLKKIGYKTRGVKS